MAVVGLATYGQLVASVQRWLDRDDDATVAEIPNFIRYGHDEIVRGLRLPIVRKTATLSLNAERVTLPTDFQAERALNIKDTLGTEIVSTSPGLRAAHAATWPAGRPCEYSIEAAALALAPIPDTAYAATLIYDASLPVMSADADTNLVFATPPFLYLAGALAPGFAFNQDGPNAALWEAKFRQTLGGVQRQGLADAMSGPLRLQPSMGFAP
jgi:hypothetical protein